MTPDEQNELLLDSVLIALRENHLRYGLSARQVWRFTLLDAPKTTEAQVLDRIEYATERGLAEEVLKGVMTQNRAWRITQAGRTHLDDRNL